MNRDELFANFKAITGSTNDTEVEQYLEACNYDLPQAIDIFYARGAEDERPKRRRNQQNGKPESNGQSTSKPVDVCMISDDEDEQGTSSSLAQQLQNPPVAVNDEVRAPMDFRSGPLINHTFEQQYGGAGGSRQTRRNGGSVFEEARDFRALARAQDSNLRAGLDPHAQNGSRSLHSLFQPPIDLIFDGEWEAARAEAQSRGVWLLVNVQDMREFACQTLNRDVWSNVGVKELVRANFLFWQIYHDSTDGGRIRSYYDVQRFPAVFVVDPRTGEQVHTVSLKTLRTQDPLSLCDSLTKFIDDFPDYATRDRAMVGDAAPMTAEQPMIDQAKGEETRIDRKRKQNGEDECEQQSCSSKKSKAAEELDVESLLRKEAEQMSIVDKDEYRKYVVQGAEAVNVLLKFPDGTRHKVELTAETMLEALFWFISGRGLVGQDHVLVMSFPKRELQLESNGHSTLAQLGFSKQELVHVELK